MKRYLVLVAWVLGIVVLCTSPMIGLTAGTLLYVYNQHVLAVLVGLAIGFIEPAYLWGHPFAKLQLIAGVSMNSLRIWLSQSHGLGRHHF